MPTVLLTAIAISIRILSNPIANVFQKRLTASEQHPLLVNFFTYLGLSILCLPIAFYTPWLELPAAFWIYAVLGGLTGALGNGFLVRALQKGDLSVLGPINAYKSVVGLIVGIFLLGEIPNIWGLMGTALIIGGSYFVLDTTAERFSLALLKRKEIQYRIWALILTAIEAVFIKKVILASGVGTAFLSWCWLGAIFALAIMLLYRLQPMEVGSRIRSTHLSQYGLLILCIGAMQLTTNYVLEHMPVGYALALFQLSTIASVILGQQLFNEQGIRRKLIGTMIMLTGSVLIILLNKD